jgi:hydrogenase nickel incorporation protein HypB
MDMAEAAEFDLALARRNIQSVRPGMRVFEVSAKKGQGMDGLVNFLAAEQSALRSAG